ncbi:hypothetical protein TSUD_76650 [Trifolium subterraneum]|uniref:Uncharacterized protein n=1 Tax=Trifolium subterraneum TaxID=3900 RepID=A0A2Z6LMZ7_TRISU|nr:hypothetical protein TSUD_76650 [Trifolium subterraneum]
MADGSSLDHLEAKTFTESHGNGDCPKDVLPASRKRKWESLSGMINWMRHIAKHPVDPVPEEPSKWKEYNGGNDFFVQLLRARDVLVVRKNVEPKSGSSSQVYFQCTY